MDDFEDAMKEIDIWDKEMIQLLIAPLCAFIEPVGSRVTCNPPPTNTDQDYLVFIPNMDNLWRVSKILIDNGYFRGGSKEDSDQFHSFKNAAGDINYILTTKSEYYNKFIAATSVAKRLNLLDKNDRIALFNAVLYGHACLEKSNAVENLVDGVDYLAITRSFF